MIDRISLRIYCITARSAPVVAVFRRGPSRWSHVGRWTLDDGGYEPGAWLRGRIFPRRSDLSPDGSYLCYFASQPSARWEHGDTYVAVSRLPWLTALHAFRTCGTWTRGYRFVEGTAGVADALRLPTGLSLEPIPVVQFANERARGWIETTDSPPSTDAWDEGRRAILEKQQPNGELRLRVERTGSFGAVTMSARYGLLSGAGARPLPDVQWADWDSAGHLLVATVHGKLQMIDVAKGSSAVLIEHDLARLRPEPVPAPAWAQRW